MKILENSPKRFVRISEDGSRIEIEEEHQHGNLETIVKFKGAGACLYSKRFLEEILKLNSENAVRTSPSSISVLLK